MQIGSSSIVPPDFVEKADMTEGEIFNAVFFKFKSLHFGGNGRTPLEDIASSFESLQKAPAEARKWIDRVVREFAAIGKAFADGDFEEVDIDTADNDLEATPSKHLLN
jgi:hypothetical protein